MVGRLRFILDADMTLLREMLKDGRLSLIDHARTQYILMCVLVSRASEVALVNSCIN